MSIETPSMTSWSSVAGIACRATVSARAGRPGQASASARQRRVELAPPDVERPGLLARPSRARRPGRRCAAGTRRARTSTAVASGAAAGTHSRSSAPRAARARRRSGSWPGATGRVRLHGEPSDRGVGVSVSSAPPGPSPEEPVAQPGHRHRRPRHAQQPDLGPSAQGRPGGQDVEPAGLDPVEDRQAAAREQVDVDGQRPRHPRHQRPALGEQARGPARPRTSSARRTPA